MSKSCLAKVLLVILPALIYLTVAGEWKFAYVWGDVPAIYWLFALHDRFFFELLFLPAVVGTVLLLLWWIIKRSVAKDLYLRPFALSLIVVNIATLLAFPVSFSNHIVHLQRLDAGGRVYYMGGYPMFDINFFVAECEPLGILCRQIYRSGDIMDSQWRNSRLTFDPTTRELRLDEPEEGLLFSYIVP